MAKTSQNEARVALITGAGKRRVGQVVAEVLAQRGYALAIHYRQSREDAVAFRERWRKQGATVELFQADLTEASAVDRMIDQVLERFGRIDVLVTAAAIWLPTPLEQLTPEDLTRHFQVNVAGTFWCCRRAGLAMVNQTEGGVIITIGDWAIERPYLNYAAYFVSKGCIPTMTRMLAVELARRNPAIRVNCILPGPVMMPENLPQHERIEAIRSTLLQREGQPEHVASAVLFLIENDYVTGVCLPVEGGRLLGSSSPDAGLS